MDVYNETRVPQFLGATISLAVLATIAVAARIAGRSISAAKFWWDDAVIIIALVLNLGLATSYWLMVSEGKLGRHTKAYGGPVDDATLVVFYKLLMAIQILYFSTAVAIKTSLIILYLRIFGVIRWFKWALAAAEVIVVLYFVVDVFVAIFECTPVAFFWDQTIPGGHCINENQFFRWNGVANLLIDFMIWSLTLPVIWHLHLNTRQKLSLSGIFLLGLVACAASIVRVITFNNVNFSDVTWTLFGTAMWTSIEQSVGIICACLPTLRPLINAALPTIKGWRSTEASSKAVKTSNTIPLSDYSSRSRHGVERSLDMDRAGFSRLDEENPADIKTVTAHAVKNGSGDLPALPPPNAILTRQTLEQHVS